MEVLVKMPADFPMQGVMDIGDHLQRVDVLVADHPDPNSNVYFAGHYLGSARLSGIRTVLLPDRNVVSRMAQVAKGLSMDEHKRNAAAILAFAQCLDIQIEPSVAFHELAYNEGSQAALDELSWFRVADNGNPHEWVAAGLGQLDRIPTVGTPPPVEQLDLERPLKRWRRNYVVAMKIGELELNRKLNAIQKVTALMEWMRDDFILAGPAAMLALLYFAPNSPPRKGLLKNIQSNDRDEALAGAKNAAWDITYLSDFARRINEESESQQTQYIFATFDKRLRDLARFVIGEHEEMSANESLAKSFERWWPAKDARRISDLWDSCVARGRSLDWWAQYKDRPDHVGELITRGEAVLLNSKSLV
ncbi:hypothetical protein ACQCP0_21070 [Ralstonia pseudosolanacearum]|uniref:hypothetical protein n=1 Tax=Ralstonia pseudosolanacearum TaxID=1310165 RepID=UPI00140329AF|nr:hypothetical protein [Ralstonia pseudosolanacearum]KAF3462094.1 hypothetical protein GO278_001381 [Ralstonia solanacearum]NKA77088.1 hypothetical protein [Ralstonia solanacearum]NKG00939.1 hypothetical protein [Ralstonia solanacearum]NKG05605.1 hypothetical protein [Ralstonia solanacearum]QKL91669.1 hypothetical protein HI802_05880 [Ralstonia solanacearum]